MNEWGQEVGNADATNGKQIPWLQDVDANQDDESDVWMNSWPVDFRDVAIVDATNVMVDQYNLTTYDLSHTGQLCHAETEADRSGGVRVHSDLLDEPGQAARRERRYVHQFDRRAAGD